MDVLNLYVYESIRRSYLQNYWIIISAHTHAYIMLLIDLINIFIYEAIGQIYRSCNIRNMADKNFL